MQVNLGDIPGSLVKSGRPPLPSSTKAAAAAVQLPGSDHPQSPKDGTVMEHRMAGDLMLGKMNKSVKKSMVQIRSKKKGSHRSDGSARSRKSMANSDMQVPTMCQLLKSVACQTACTCRTPIHVCEYVSMCMCMCMCMCICMCMCMGVNMGIVYVLSAHVV